jgi:predicted  nucleic acid-binding Zn-ribbon protein
LAEKHIREFEASLESKGIALESVQVKLAERQSHLDFKKAELDTIIAETKREEELLLAKSGALSEVIGDDRLLSAYQRIRAKVRNGLAVVSIERGASAGSFFTIPPQRQMEIAQRKKITIDEHSGRILVDPILAQEEEHKMALELAAILG